MSKLDVNFFSICYYLMHFFPSQRSVGVFHCYWNMVGTFNDHVIK